LQSGVVLRSSVSPGVPVGARCQRGRSRQLTESPIHQFRGGVAMNRGIVIFGLGALVAIGPLGLAACSTGNAKATGAAGGCRRRRRFIDGG
jgi:hypothetical protein